MGRKFRLTVCLAVLLICTGCQLQTGDTDVESKKVVSKITVTCHEDGSVTNRTYTSQTKMKEILNGIRQLGQKMKPDVDPEQLNERLFSITLLHTDGSQQHYQTKADRYIRRGQEPWQQADPKKVSELNVLLQTLPADSLV